MKKPPFTGGFFYLRRSAGYCRLNVLPLRGKYADVKGNF